MEDRKKSLSAGAERDREIRQLERTRLAIAKDIEDVMNEYRQVSGDRSLRRERIRLPREVLDDASDGEA